MLLWSLRVDIYLGGGVIGCVLVVAGRYIPGGWGSRSWWPSTYDCLRPIENSQLGQHFHVPDRQLGRQLDS